MIEETTVREMIEEITKKNQHILDQKMATLEINAVVALMQLSAIVKLDTLYWILEEKRPRFEYDTMTRGVARRTK